MDTTNIAALCREVAIEAPNTPAPTPSPPPPTPALPTPQPTPLLWIVSCQLGCMVQRGVRWRAAAPALSVKACSACGGTACPTTLSDLRTATLGCACPARTHLSLGRSARAHVVAEHVWPVQVQQLAEKPVVEAAWRPYPLAKQEVRETQPGHAIVSQPGTLSSCSRSCGSGTKQRTRTVKKPAAHGKRSWRPNAGARLQYRLCEVPCVIDEWGSRSLHKAAAMDRLVCALRSRTFADAKAWCTAVPMTRDVQDATRTPAAKIVSTSTSRDNMH